MLTYTVHLLHDMQETLTAYGNALVILEKGEEGFSLNSLLYFLEHYEYVTQSKEFKKHNNKTLFKQNLLYV